MWAFCRLTYPKPLGYCIGIRIGIGQSRKAHMKKKVSELDLYTCLLMLSSNIRCGLDPNYSDEAAIRHLVESSRMQPDGGAEITTQEWAEQMLVDYRNQRRDLWPADLGRAGGKSKSAAKSDAARANGRKGGRPKKDK